MSRWRPTAYSLSLIVLILVLVVMAQQSAFDDAGFRAEPAQTPFEVSDMTVGPDAPG